MIAKGENSISLMDILNKVSEADLVSFYLGVSKIPCVIKSPLRKDTKASFGLYSMDGKRIHFTDFATRERGGLFDLLERLWCCDYRKVLGRISQELPLMRSTTATIRKCEVQSSRQYNSNCDLQCKVRDWQLHDLEYWGSYGIPLEWLIRANVYPISHKIIIKNGETYVFSADRYAYVFVERKDSITLKIYQPYSKEFKWCNKHDGSVLSLWTLLPKRGDRVCICSSLKDSLCLWHNMGIPSIAMQGEGYRISDTVIKELKERFNSIYILLDNDPPGIYDSTKLAEETGFTNIILPSEYGEKDISDLYRAVGRDSFIKIISSLFN